MKKLLLSLIVLGLFGCSSASKNDYANDSGDVTDQAKAAIEDAAEDLKNAAEDLKTAANDKAAEVQTQATETVNSAVSSFDTYTGTESSKVTCTSGNDVRTITVLNGDAGGCGVVYNKQGVDKTVAVAKNVMQYCTDIQDKIKGNLEGPGFTCQ